MKNFKIKEPLVLNAFEHPKKFSKNKWRLYKRLLNSSQNFENGRLPIYKK
jgi:hypothetical protein